MSEKKLFPGVTEQEITERKQAILAEQKRIDAEKQIEKHAKTNQKQRNQQGHHPRVKGLPFPLSLKNQQTDQKPLYGQHHRPEEHSPADRDALLPSDLATNPHGKNDGTQRRAHPQKGKQVGKHQVEKIHQKHGNSKKHPGADSAKKTGFLLFRKGFFHKKFSVKNLFLLLYHLCIKLSRFRSRFLIIS